MADTSAIQSAFQKWVADGSRTAKRACPPPDRASTLQSADKEKVMCRIVTEIMVHLGPVLEEALASELRGMKAKSARERKRQRVRMFFLQADNGLQDAMSKLAIAWRTNTMTQDAASFLGLEWQGVPNPVPVESGPAEARASPCDSGPRPWHDLSKRQQRHVLKEFADKILERCSTTNDAEELVCALSRKIMRSLGGKNSERTNKNCNRCSLLLEQLKDCRESTADKPALDIGKDL